MRRTDWKDVEAGHGKRTYGERRTRRICFRLTEEEYRGIEEAREISGLSLSALVRSRILGTRVVPRADLAVLAELRRLGGLFKHFFNETGGAYSKLTAQAIRDISAYARKLTDECGNSG